MRKDRRAALSALGALATLPWPVAAQDRGAQWPTRAVKIVVGSTAGNSSDVAARLYADELTKSYGVPFIVDNRPGAGGTLAVESFIRQNDDHTVLFGASSLIAAAPHMYPALRYDTVKDIDTVALIGRTPLILVVRSDFPAKTFPEFLAAAKAAEKAGAPLTFGSSGTGAMNHLTMELLKHRAGLKMAHIPYRGSAQAMTDLIGGQIQVLFETPTTVYPNLPNGRLRPLATSMLTRIPELPEMPTVAESIPGFESVTWAVFCVLPTAPAEMKQRLAEHINRATLLPQMRTKMAGLGIGAVSDTTPATSRAYWLSEYGKWRDLIKILGIRIE